MQFITSNILQRGLGFREIVLTVINMHNIFSSKNQAQTTKILTEQELMSKIQIE